MEHERKRNQAAVLHIYHAGLDRVEMERVQGTMCDTIHEAENK